MYDTLLSSAKSLWWAGWGLCEDDPEARAKMLFCDQVRRVGLSLSLDSKDSIEKWFHMIRWDPMVMVDPRFPDSAVCVCSMLPDKLMRAMPDQAAVFVVSFTKLRSNRPWRADWCVALGMDGPCGSYICDIELYKSEFTQVR